MTETKRQIIKDNYANYLNEILEEFKILKELKDTHGNNTKMYALDSSIYVNRLDALVKDIENYLCLNDIRSFEYSYTVRYDAGIDEILMPANSAGSIINAINKTIRALSPKSKLILKNILRGSTIFCFDYEEQHGIDSAALDTEGKLRDLRDAFQLDDEHAKKEIDTMIDKERISQNVIKSFKGLTPATGSETKVFIQTAIKNKKPLELDGDLRKKINTIYPSRQNQDSRIDWLNNKASGYIREINDVTRSFILYEDMDSDESESGMIKIYYEDESFKSALLDRFTTRIKVGFEKQGRKYMLNNLK